ncbi:MAG: hypothetical protein EOO41_02145, partial [Methanobacteriota archaeon]
HNASMPPASTLVCALPLLMPTPNARAGLGDHQEALLLHPAPMDSGVHAHVESDGGVLVTLSAGAITAAVFLGQFLGIALRSRLQLDLRLAPCMWKLLSDSKLCLDDIVAVDAAFGSMLSSLRNAAQEYAHGLLLDVGVPPTDWSTPACMLRALDAAGGGHAQPHSALDEAVPGFEDLEWSATLACGAVVQLSPAASTPLVTLRHMLNGSYEHALVAARVSEWHAVVPHVLQGLYSVVPPVSLYLLTPAELELAFCGVQDVDIDLLAAQTEYDASLSPDHPLVTSFWRVLKSFSPAQRRLFLRFTWGRTRLPANAADFQQKFKLQKLDLGSAPAVGVETEHAVESAGASPQMGARLPVQAPPLLPPPLTSRTASAHSHARSGSADAPVRPRAMHARPATALPVRQLSARRADAVDGTAAGSGGGSAQSTRGLDRAVARRPESATERLSDSTRTLLLPRLPEGAANAATSNAQPAHALLARAIDADVVPRASSAVSRASARTHTDDVHVSQAEALVRPVSALARDPAPLAARGMMHIPQRRSSQASMQGADSSAGVASTSPVPNPDAMFPTSHVCFFALRLPEYSCDEVLRRQLLYAITSCVAMDADYRLADRRAD